MKNGRNFDESFSDEMKDIVGGAGYSHIKCDDWTEQDKQKYSDLAQDCCDALLSVILPNLKKLSRDDLTKLFCMLPVMVDTAQGICEDFIGDSGEAEG